MGRDKAVLEVGGETLLARAVRCLHDAGAAPVVVASGSAGRLGPLPWPEVDDGAFAGAGPLAGILAALRTATTPRVAVLAVDLPDASAAVVRWLAAQWRPDDTVLVPVDPAGRAQPLHGVMSGATSVADAIEAELTRGERRVQRVLAALGGRRVVVPAEVDSRSWSRNWNTPE